MSIFLPKLKVNANVSEPTQAGQWYECSIDVLEKISSGLDKDGKININLMDHSEIKAAIPDVWASYLLFDMAFFDASHPLHISAVNEWRGLLAMIALQNLLSIPIKMKKVDLVSSDSTILGKVLRNTPNYQISLTQSSSAWDNVFVISYNNKTIGITSPKTFVSPAVNYFNIISHTNVQWFNGGDKLQNPFEKTENGEYKYLNTGTADALVWWLRELYNNLKNFNCENNSDKNKLVQELKLFLDEGPNRNPIHSKKEGIYSIQETFLKLIDFTVESKQTDSADSPLFIKSIDGRKRILIAKKIAEQWGRNLNDIKVINHLTLSEYDTIKDQRLNYPGIEIIEPEELFLDQLTIVINQSFPGCKTIEGLVGLENKGRKLFIFLPIKEKLLNIFSIDDIIKNSSIKYEDNKYIFAFTFKLNGGNYIYSKNYDKPKIIDANVAFEIWPSFKSNRWNNYISFIRYATKRKEAFEVKPKFMEKTEVSLKPHQQGNEDFDFWRTEHFPEIFECFQNEKPLGFIFPIVEDRSSSNNDSNWTLGIDFGTDNTNIAVNNGISSADLILQGKYILPITESGTQRDDLLFHRFIPGIDILAPFPSVLHDFNGEINEPLSDCHILFLQEGKELPPQNIGEIKINLKWSNTPSDRKRLFLFLKQVLLHIFLEADYQKANKITLKYSYPSAFNIDAREQFNSFWNLQAKDFLKTITIISFEIKEPLTESVASAIYFGGAVDGLISLDIGGGTTDISVWQNNNLIYQTSLLFAGRQIFTRWFEHSLLLKSYCINAPKNFFDKVVKERNNDETRSSLLVDMLIRDEDYFKKTFPEINGSEDFKKFLKLSQFGFFAIIFYLSTLLKNLPGFDKLKHINIKLGGNGSKVINWYTIDGKFKSIFESILETEGGLAKGKCPYKLSDKPKSEVARGLVKPAPDMYYSKEDFPLKYVSGEIFIKNGIECNEKEEIEEKDFLEGIQLAEKLPSFERFISLINKKRSADDKYDPINYGELIPTINTYLSTLKGKERGRLTIKPIFFMIVDEYLENYSKKIWL
jgi:hypothetical protein